VLEGLVLLVTTATAVFHCTTYLLFVYERRAHAQPSPAGPFAPAAAAWVGEWLALIVIVVSWPFGFIPVNRPTSAGAGRPVVLVHGWSLNRASMALLAARLRNDGRTVFSINYRTRGIDMDAKASEVAGKLRDILVSAGADRLDVVAHSLGGLVMRAVVRYHSGAEFLGNVVTLGSPHKGSSLVYLSKSPDLIQLRPNSPFLQRLANNDPTPDTVYFTAISSTFDAIVFNDSDSDYAGALNISLDYIGHHVLLASPTVYILIKENLEARPTVAAAG
jgi:triacylglycerol esterase/lipase EstA (alpha/beta hydrolase family)